MSSIRETFFQGRTLLQNFPHPDLDTRLLLCESASLSEEQFFASPEKELPKQQVCRFLRLIRKRQRGFPLAYLTGKKEFWSMNFTVNPGVLIPRPETELVVEVVLGLPPVENGTVADIGTGCGNIAVSLAGEFPQARIVATDISKKALETARGNAESYKLDRIEFHLGDLFNPLKKLGLENTCDFIVSNPPYVSQAEWENLSVEVKEHEPKKALVAGETGLECITALIKGAVSYLKPDGYLVFEAGAGQKEKVKACFQREWSDVCCHNDVNGIPRVFSARKA